MFEPEIQRLDFHKLMLTRSKKRLSNSLFIDFQSVNDVSQKKVALKDFILSGEDWLFDSGLKTIAVECKTETYGRNLLCLELGANIRGKPNTEQRRFSPTESSGMKLRCLNLPKDSDNRGFLLAEKPELHLFCSWNQALGIWTIWNSQILCEWVMKDIWSWEACFGRSHRGNRSWHSICCLIPEDVALASPGLLHCAKNVAPEIFTEQFCKAYSE